VAREADAERGRHRIDPAVVVKRQRDRFCAGLRPKRQLLRVVTDRLHLRLLSQRRPQ